MAVGSCVLLKCNQFWSGAFLGLSYGHVCLDELIVCISQLHLAAWVCHLSRRISALAMASCVDVILAWAIGGLEVRKWHGVPVGTFLHDLVSEELLEELPTEVKVVHKEAVLKRPLRHQLKKFVTTHGEDGALVFGLVGVQPRYDLIPYICLAGETAVRMRELELSFNCPRRQPQRFIHAFLELCKAFDDEPKSNFGRQIVELMRTDLPGCVLRRKISRFFSDVNGPHCPLAVRCVLLFDARGELHLRLDTCWYTLVEDPDDAAVVGVKAAVDLIYKNDF